MDNNKPANTNYEPEFHLNFTAQTYQSQNISNSYDHMEL